MEQSIGITDKGLSILMPPREIFLHGDTENHTDLLLEQKTIVYEFDHAEYPETGGIFIYYKGVKYPKKCFPFPEALSAVQVVKRSTRVFLSMGALPILFNFKKFVAEYCRLADWSLRPYYLKANRYATSTIELRLFITNFMATVAGMTVKNIGNGSFEYKCSVKKDIQATFHVPSNLALIVATIIEYDNAYRYMMQDICSTVYKEELYLDPRGTIKKMMATFAERAQPEVTRKVGLGIKILLLALLVPRVKKAFQAALDLCDFAKLKMDDIDAHHCLIQQDYRYNGKSLHHRMKMYKACYPDGLPVQLEVINARKV